MNATKPLGRKAYGSIPHLPGSRQGPGDHHCHEGQADICSGVKSRKGDQVTVTVKLDGSCVAIYRDAHTLVPLIRAGYRAENSHHEQHHLFASWVLGNANRFTRLKAALEPGQRLVGEWLALAHGTMYDLWHDPFVPFDLMVDDARLTYTELLAVSTWARLWTPTVLSIGPMSIADAEEAIKRRFHGETDSVEGAVWRVENNGRFDFLAKWVRPDKVDGSYLTMADNNLKPTWNWRPHL